MTVIVVLHLTIDWHHSKWLGTVYDYDYNRTDPTHTDNHYDYDRMVLVYRNYHSLITTRFFATATITIYSVHEYMTVYTIYEFLPPNPLESPSWESGSARAPARAYEQF